MSAFERFTTATAPVPPERRRRLYVACFTGRPDLAAVFCSKSCAVARYTEGPDGFLVVTRTLPGYLRVDCAGCNLPVPPAA